MVVKCGGFGQYLKEERGWGCGRRWLNGMQGDCRVGYRDANSFARVENDKTPIFCRLKIIVLIENMEAVLGSYPDGRVFYLQLCTVLFLTLDLRMPIGAGMTVYLTLCASKQ